MTSSASPAVSTGSGVPAVRAAAPPAPAGHAQPAPARPTRTSAARAALRRRLEGTPGRLRVLALLTAGACLVFGLAAGQAFNATDGALARAEANTAQLVRIQALHTNLVKADANATNAFLVGGIEPASTRADYDNAIGQASRLVAEAARAQPADGRALSALNAQLVTYTGLVEQARANNRQGLPLGAQYLRNASAGLRANALPIVNALVTANQLRVRAELDNAAGASAWMLVGLLSLVVLVFGMVWLARRIHRYLNLPMVAATVAVLLTFIVGALVLGGVRGQVADVRDGPYAATLATARARIAGFDAKSNESLTLIARGSGSTFETAWKASSGVVQAQARQAAGHSSRAGGLSDPWAHYARIHASIRAVDDAGRWDDAVAIATGSGANTSNAAFDAFDTASSRALTAVGRDTADGLSAPRPYLPFAGAFGLLVGLLGALACWWGVSKRLEEYR
ncbi:MAG: hypothetical protein ACXVYU_01005 [Oryzihumus sp.]